MQELGQPTTDPSRRRIRRAGPTIGRHGRGESSAHRHLLGSNHRLLGGIFGSGDSSPGDASANRRISGKKQGDDMSLSVGSSKLNDALKELRARWEDTRARWQDEVAQEIEEQFQSRTLKAERKRDADEQTVIIRFATQKESLENEYKKACQTIDTHLETTQKPLETKHREERLEIIDHYKKEKEAAKATYQETS